jgi:hypothetical protein
MAAILESTSPTYDGTVPQPASVLADRYGAPSRARRPLVIGLAVLLALVGAAWLVWAIAFHGRPQVSSEMVAFDVSAQHSATGRFSVVRRSADVPATCVLQAFAADHAVVGEVSVPVGRDRPATSTVSATLRTERQATSVDLVGCTAPGQKQPR